MVNWAELDADTIKQGISSGTQIAQQRIKDAADLKQQQMQKEAALAQLILGKKLQSELDREAVESDIELAKREQKKLKPGERFDITVGKARIGSSESRDPSGMVTPREKRQIIDSMNRDWKDGYGGKMSRGLQAAQSVLNGIESGDITTAGRVKANLPVLEGENYKATDAEREIMIQYTGSGDYANFLNYTGLSGDKGNVVLSKPQLNAIHDFAKSRVGEFSRSLERAKEEHKERWGDRAYGVLGADEANKVFSSYGMSSAGLMKHITDSDAYKNQPGTKARQPDDVAPLSQQGSIDYSAPQPQASAPQPGVGALVGGPGAPQIRSLDQLRQKPQAVSPASQTGFAPPMSREEFLASRNKSKAGKGM